MPNKGLRASWLPKLADALGWKPQRLRILLNRNGYEHPYRSELKALQILKAYGISFAKYRPTEDAVGVDVEPIASPVPIRGMTIATSTQAPKKMIGAAMSAAPTDTKRRGKWSDRLLVSRLARVLGGITAANKARVRYLLKKAGHSNIKDVDEATALTVLQAEGFDIAGFEYETKPGEPGGMLVVPPSNDYEELRAQYIEMGERLRKMAEGQATREAEFETKRKKYAAVRQGLVSYEAQVLPIAMKKFGGLVQPLNYPIDVLNLIRDE
jgi:hypothetical protein